MKYLIIVIGLVVAVGVYFASVSEETAMTPSAEEKKVAPAEPAPAAPTSRPLEKRKAYEAPRQVEIPSSFNLSAECRNYWGELLKLDLSDERVIKMVTPFPSGKGCVTPPEFQNLQKAYETECLVKNSKLSKEAQQQRCFYSLFMYRANLDDFLTKDMRVDQISDPAVLVDKLFARFLKNPASAVEVADRLLELYPDYYPAAQTQVFAKILGQFGTGKKFNADSPEYAEITSGVEKLERMKPDDAQNRELEMFLVTLADGKVEQVREKASEILAQDPHSSIGAYYLAWSEFQMGNGGKGMEWLSRAAQLAPEDQRIKNTLARAKANPNFYKSSDPRVKTIFEMKLKTNIDMPFTK